MLGFGKWRPDQLPLNITVAGDAKGVLPAPDGYAPWSQPAQLSAALSTVGLGGFAAHASTGSLSIFGGTATKLVKYASATSWTDLTRLVGGAYGVATDETWRMDQYGTRLIATNATDDPQYIDIDAGANFAALSGSPPKARYNKTVGDFVFLYGLVSNRNRLIWSGRNNSDFWTPGTQDCDQQDFPEGGEVNGVAAFGQGRGLVFQEEALRAFAATNDRTIFNFAKLESGVGLLAPDSLVTAGGLALFLSRSGFRVSDGTGPSRSIGTDAVDKWFQAAVSNSRTTAVRGALDPIRQRVFWIFPTGSGTVFDKCLVYDIALDAWSYGDVNASFIFPAATAGYTADNIQALLTSLGYTIETAPFSFDAKFLTGGSPFLAILDDDFKLAFFSGTAMAATVETGDVQLIPGMRAFVRGARPVTDATAATIAAGTKERAQGSATFGSASAQNDQGLCPLRSSGRFHRFRMAIAEGQTWTHARGVSLDDEGQTPLFVAAGTR